MRILDKILNKSIYQTGGVKSVKNKFTSGGTTEAQPVLPKKVVKLDGKYIEVGIDTNKKPTFATKNDIDISKLRKTTLGDEYDLEGTTYLLNSEEPTPVESIKPTTVVDNTIPVVPDDKKESAVIPTFKVNKDTSLPKLNTDTPTRDVSISMSKSQNSTTKKDIGRDISKSDDKTYKDVGLAKSDEVTTEAPVVEKESTKKSGTPIKEYQRILGIEQTGIISDNTVNTFNNTILDGLKSGNTDYKKATLNIYENAPKELLEKSWIYHAKKYSLTYDDIEEFGKDFAHLYVAAPVASNELKQTLKTFPYLQKYIDIEKSKSVKSYTYGGYTRRFI